jgi:opacity protein-like surface antigen
MLKKTGVICFALILLAASAWAQDNKVDVELGAAGELAKQSVGNGTFLNPTNSFGFLGQLRYRFSRYVAVEGSFSRALNSQIYTVGPNAYRIHDDVVEYSGAVVVSPIETPKYEVFVLGGVGVLKFNPGATFINGFEVPVAAVAQTKPVFVYGAGVDYKVYTQHVALRLQYRGLFYRAPDFSFPGFFTGDSGHIAQPSVGVVFKF